MLKVKNVTISSNHPLTLISGPCVIESRDKALYAAEFLKKLTEKYGIQLIYKSSYDKANRSSIHSFRGLGIETGLTILAEVKKNFDLPILTDVHSPQDAAMAASVCDVIQVPAFLCRQTDLLIACANTNKVVNVKKGQFVASWDMKNVVDKIVESGNNQIIVTERGYTFGYNNLVTDMRAFPIMKKFGFPVCFDATHSVQLPGGDVTSSSGEREHIFTLAKAALAAGADLLFMEAHNKPEEAKSDAKCQIPFSELEKMLPVLIKIYELTR
ncbi:MAG: 3-deoxy-8-phosphooctulonate synthase [Chlamydiales bacterium]|nr:3-deoxy-8-phosphooctulonate synthase [Chlamydiales bacterium]